MSDAQKPGSILTVPLRPCLMMLAVCVLAVAMAWTTQGIYGTYSPVNIIAALAAGAIALAACTLPRRAWQFPPVVGRVVIVAACLFLAVHTGYRILDPEDRSASLAMEVVTQTPPPAREAGDLDGLDLGIKAGIGLTALLMAALVGLRRRAPASFAAAALAALALLLSGEAVFCTALRNPPLQESYVRAVHLAALAGFGLTATLLIHLGTPAVRWRALFGGQVVLLFAAGTVLRVAAALVAPDPDIDVYDAEQQGTDQLLAGHNPYTAEYRSVPPASRPGAPFYPPLPILIGTPFRAVGWDIRLGNAVCDVLAAVAILFAARGHGLVGGLLAATYLNFPIAPFILEVAWNEPMLAAFLGLGLVSVARGWRFGYFLLGIGLTGKQYGLMLVPTLWQGLRGRRLGLILGIAAAVCITIGPFFLWNPQAFLDRVMFYHLNLDMREDALTVLAAAKHGLDLDLPKWLAGGFGLMLIGLVAWRTPSGGHSPAPWVGASLLLFCLCHTQAFPNYFYLCQYLMLLGLGSWFVDAAEQVTRNEMKIATSSVL